jgi:hypothetical protein
MCRTTTWLVSQNNKYRFYCKLITNKNARNCGCGEGEKERVAGTRQTCLCNASCSLMTSAPLIFDVPIVSDDARLERPSKFTRPEDPATSRHAGSITYDREHGYSLEWESIDDFHRWRKSEETAHGIELRSSQIRHRNGSAVYTTSQLFCCSRQGTGGLKLQERKSDRKKVIETKRIAGGCPCRVRIKMYPHTSTVLGSYNSNHSHPTGKDNLKHVWIWVPTRELIEKLIRLGLKDKEIVSHPLPDNY